MCIYFSCCHLQDNKQIRTLGLDNLISSDYNFRLPNNKIVVPITVCLWDPAVLTCSATLVVVIGGRRLFRLSGSGEGEVSCSCAVRNRVPLKTSSTVPGVPVREWLVLMGCRVRGGGFRLLVERDRDDVLSSRGRFGHTLGERMELEPGRLSSRSLTKELQNQKRDGQHD